MEKLWYDFANECWLSGEVIDWKKEPIAEPTKLYLFESNGTRCIVNAHNERQARTMIGAWVISGEVDLGKASCIVLNPDSVNVGVVARETWGNRRL